MPLRLPLLCSTCLRYAPPTAKCQVPLLASLGSTRGRHPFAVVHLPPPWGQHPAVVKAFQHKLKHKVKSKSDAIHKPKHKSNRNTPAEHQGLRYEDQRHPAGPQHPARGHRVNNFAVMTQLCNLCPSAPLPVGFPAPSLHHLPPPLRQHPAVLKANSIQSQIQSQMQTHCQIQTQTPSHLLSIGV